MHTLRVNNLTVQASDYPVVEITVTNWSTVFCEDKTFCRLLIVVPLKYTVNLTNQNRFLVGQTLKLVRKWPMASCYF